MKLSVRVKLMAASLAVALMMSFGGGFATYYIYSLNSEIDNLVELTGLSEGKHQDVNNDVLAIEQRSEKIFEVAKIIVGFGTVFAAVCSFGFGLYLSKSLSEPVKALDKAAKKIAAGDLTETDIDIKNKDEIGHLADSFSQMAKGLHQLILEVKEKSTVLAEASQQISATNQQISAGSQNQAHQVHVISESISELSSLIEKVNQSVQEASTVSEQTNEKAHEGRAVVSNSINGMQNVNKLINELGENSSQIGEIIGLIEEIADQTNLLALNAAIEAARAGEHGKGFAVVAEHVRQLAEKSSQSTKQINRLITKIQKGIEQTVKAVAKGTSQIDATGLAFEEIEGYIGNTSSQVVIIGEAVKEQVHLSNEVLRAIEEIAAITQETAAGNQEAAASTQHLVSLADGLQEVTDKFKI